MNCWVLKRGRSAVCLSRIGIWLMAAVVFLWVSAIQAQTQVLIDTYMDHWKDFYPSSAFSEGQKSAAWRFEDFSKQRISDWLLFNQQAEKTLLSIPASAPLNKRVDTQVLLRQVRLELELWEQDDPLTRQPQWYTGKISEALTYVLVSERLTPAETFRAVSTRLEGVSALCQLGIENIQNGNPARTRGALKSLQRTIGFYENELLKQSAAWTEKDDL